MQEQLKHWLFDPTVGKFVAALIGLGIVYTLSRIAQRSANRFVADADARYRGRKFIAFLSYLVAIGVVATIFRSKLEGLMVAFGVAGAGVAFALQEVIASAAGWVVVSVGGYYSAGDRVQLGGIKGDVIETSEFTDDINGSGTVGQRRLVQRTHRARCQQLRFQGTRVPMIQETSLSFGTKSRFPCVTVRTGNSTLGKFTNVVNEICKDYAIQSMAAWKQAVDRYRLEDAKIEPMITLAATDNWIEFTIRYIVDYRKRRFVRDRIFTRMLQEVDKSENRIRLASATFELANLPRLDIRFSDGKGAIDPKYVP